MKKTTVKRVLIPVSVIILIIIGIAFYWINDGYSAMEEALVYLESSEDVAVQDNDQWLHFQPTEENPEEVNERTGFIYYPGARVDYRSYGPLMNELAREGVEGFLVKMPLDLAFFGSNRAEAIITEHEEIDRWIIGGHSLGGAMAARFVYNHPEQVSGLVLLAAYPASSNDLSGYDKLPVLSIYGDRDGFVTDEDIENSRDNLPNHTRWMEIEGGNHSQFGWYGFQQGDQEAEISREKQQERILEGLLDWLEEGH